MTDLAGDHPFARSVRALGADREEFGAGRFDQWRPHVHQGGPCEICKRTIDAERVEAIPETRLCVEHARMIGKYGGEFLVTATRESLGKAGSLKRNYGDIVTQKRRNQTAIDKLRHDYLEGLRSEEQKSG